MSNLRPNATLPVTARARKTPKRDRLPLAAISPERVKGMLLEMAFLLHATRVVGWKGGAVAPKKG